MKKVFYIICATVFLLCTMTGCVNGEGPTLQGPTGSALPEGEGEAPPGSDLLDAAQMLTAEVEAAEQSLEDMRAREDRLAGSLAELESFISDLLEEEDAAQRAGEYRELALELETQLGELRKSIASVERRLLALESAGEDAPPPGEDYAPEIPDNIF